MRISIDLDGLTFGELYNFADLARNAHVDPADKVIVETEDGIGNDVGAHTLAADLGLAAIEPPVLLRRADASRYVDALARELAQESDKADLGHRRALPASLRPTPHRYPPRLPHPPPTTTRSLPGPDGLKIPGSITSSA